MKLVWKLLRQHISIGQFSGFTLANMIGMTIILLGLQFYQDVSSIFSSKESFMKKDYIIVTKQINAVSTLTGKGTNFSKNEINELKNQSFTRSLGVFQPADFRVSASMGMKNVGMQFSTEMFFESVPDEYVDFDSSQWIYRGNDNNLPIILPRNYLNLYNFGFAQTRGLPKLSENVLSMISMNITVSGNQKQGLYKGKIVGFSNRLNTILVPQSFMNWANEEYGKNESVEPSRLILEVYNPTDDSIVKYFQDKGYETEDDKLEQGKTAWFLKIVVGIVMGVGILITVLALYVLMLSIYLLVQKNTTKLENLLLIGYSPSRVAMPYQLLTFFLNGFVFVCALMILVVVRGYYLEMLESLYPDLLIGGLGTTLLLGIILFITVSLLNMWVIRLKIASIWKRKE